MSRDFQLPGRSPVIASEGMAATSHPLATLAAIDVLRAGGNAVDAAVAAVAVLCVIEPHMTGIGGDCFALIAEPGKPVWGYNGCGRSGAKSSTEALLEKGMTSIEPTSPHAVNVPGAIEAWGALLKTKGTWPFDRVLAPAIKYAEHGFPVAPRVASDWKGWVSKLRNSTGATKHYLPNGGTPAEGDIMKLPALARTLKAIAKDGAKAFYEGPIAEDMASTLAAKGSVLSVEDFAKHRGEAVTPISTNYRGVDLVEIPPNTQGLTALVTLNILENFDLAALEALGPDRFHLMLEAARMGFAVRDTHIAEPSFMRVSVDALNDKVFAKTLAAKLDRTKRVPLPPAPTPGSDTVYLTVVDRDRCAVSLINSLYSSFGTGICTEKTGVLFNNRGSGFVLKPDHPNALGPSKRPMHTIIPALAMRGGRCDTTFGVMGAHYQPMGHVQMVLNLFDYGMDIQSAIDAPRAFFEGESTVIERGMPAATVEGLKARGHKIVEAPSPWGGAQAIRIDWDRGVLIGGSEPRKDGCALGY
ncbi:gamma-glutamyltransferase [Rhodoplanes sp. Z2-YC6860]|uniref:gamma-glutamyltransferase n=1 Tax=Rhodoplanes sp. Z2-YC6860 TaxID=674703 RepID=UPI00078E7567|nr:gamma-glutamyltransferase [Rhodoplanes sp. Z2-YC6860]AMN45349.1 gamma-glutamyltranspeptidase [Rhodoplanes sp. Z2-YC6860]